MAKISEDRGRSKVICQRVKIPEFKVVKSPIISIADIKRRRFNIIDRNYVYWQDEIENIIESEKEDD